MFVLVRFKVVALRNRLLYQGALYLENCMQICLAWETKQTPELTGKENCWAVGLWIVSKNNRILTHASLTYLNGQRKWHMSNPCSTGGTWDYPYDSHQKERHALILLLTLIQYWKSYLLCFVH